MYVYSLCMVVLVGSALAAADADDARMKRAEHVVENCKQLQHSEEVPAYIIDLCESILADHEVEGLLQPVATELSDEQTQMAKKQQEARNSGYYFVRFGKRADTVSKKGKTNYDYIRFSRRRRSSMLV